MSYAGKTLLVVLLTKLASLGSATVALKGWGLMGLKAGKSASVSRVMTEVAALLQAHHDDPASTHEVNTTTQGPVDLLNAALERTISEIEEQVHTQIIASHDATQAEINKRIEDLIKGNTDVTNQKEAADAADDEWMQCVSNEQGMSKDIEDANAALEQSRNDRSTKCQLQEDNRYFAYQTDPEQIHFVCDISLSPEHNCDVQWQEFEYDVAVDWESFIDDVDNAVRVHDGHAYACQQAQADEMAKEESLRRAIERYEGQHERCLGYQEARQLAMCNFETKYRGKCDLVTLYRNLMEEIDTVDGSDYSHPDRVQEWTLTSTTICLFHKIIETSTVDTTHINACEADVNTDHLNLSRQQQRFTELTTPPNYDCAETTITFQGETWNIPASAPRPPPPSASYERVPFHPELPFSFC